jgi:uncharacterized membrane protein YraQ (UPF0718 family)
VTGARRHLIPIVLVCGFGVLVGGSLLLDFQPGRQIGLTFASTAKAMIGVLPCAFILIALFEIWVKRETVERHLGTGSGWRGYFWVTLLAGMTVGGLYLAFPVASSLASKGARLSVILAYVGLAGICRFPMLMFEASFLGWRFTAIRLSVAVPLVIITSWAMGRVLEQRGYEIGHGL